MSQTDQTLGDFLKVLRASGLVAPDALEPRVAAWRNFSDPVPEDLLRELLDAGLVTHWQLDQLRKGKHKGFMLGKYKLLRLLGAGGMSSVYLAEHSTLGNQVAIKVLPVKRVDESSYLARFQREAQAAARLNHPNIARVVDLDTAGSVHFMVMEYVEGTDLNIKVKEEGPLEVADAVEFIRQAALGLHYAHEEGFVHRDIKPANLMIDKRGTIKILDLGLALTHTDDDDEQASLTKEHNEKVLGTADYLAPEQATNSHEADRRSDIYSLGCTLYFLLIGKAPYATGSLAQRMRAQVMEPAPNLLEKRSDVPATLAEIYYRMMEKNREARQQSAQEVADSLALWLNAHAAGAPQPRADVVRRPAARRPGSTSPGVKRLPPPPGRVYRSGPGSRSGSDIRVGGSDAGRPAGPASSASASRPDVDLSSLSFTLGPSSGSQSTGKLPAITVVSRKAPVPAPAPAAVAAAAAKTPPQPANQPPGKPRSRWSPPKLPALQWPTALRHLGKKQIAGLPLVFWLIVAGAVIAVIGLAIAALTR